MHAFQRVGEISVRLKIACAVTGSLRIDYLEQTFVSDPAHFLNQRHKLSLRITVAVDVALCCLDRLMPSQQLNIPQ